MSREPRRCIFCGSNANSGEHFWPTWLHRVLGPVPASSRHDRLTLNYHPTTGQTITGPRGRQGDQRSARIRAVCGRCNNGWMNRLERDARPFITTIVSGTPAVLGKQAVETVAQWLALKAIVVEHGTPDASLTPQQDRTAFMRDRTIPEYFRIYVAHNISNRRLFFYRHSHCMSVNSGEPRPPLDGTAKNIQAVTFIAGKAVFQVTSARIDNFILEENIQVIGFHDRCRIWPLRDMPVGFPARPRIADNGILHVASMLERLFAHRKATWL